VGFAVAFPRLELQHATFSWTLPGARGGLLAGTVLVGVCTAGAAALVLGRAAPLSFAVPALAVGFFWFVAGSVVADVALPRMVRWPLVLAWLLAVVRPAESSRLLDAWPWTFALLALGMGTGLLAAQFSRRSSRARHFLWSSAAPGATALYWAGRKGVARDWTQSLATERLGPWLRAAAYEGSGGRAVSFPARHLFLAFAVLWGHLTNQPGITIIMVGSFLSVGQIGLFTTLPYPLSRVRRAHVALAGAAMEAVTVTAFIAVLVVGTQAAGIPVLGWFAGEEPGVTWGAAVGMAWAWAPVAQWVSIRWPVQRQPPDVQRRFFLPWFVAVGVYVLLGLTSARALTGASPLVHAAAVLGIGVALYGALWIAVHRHFARADLL
jgi:hypothetical protein